VQSPPSAPPDEPSRPQGIGLTALAAGALIAVDFVRGLLHLLGGTLSVLPVIERLFPCLIFFLEVLVLWHYWKGRNWARAGVLIASFLIAASGFSILIDRGGSFLSLMSHPLTFFKALLACFLLYWLNTRPVRAWFKKVSATSADLITEHLVNKLCTAAAKQSGPSSDSWRLSFEHDVELTLACPWRIVLDDNLAFASDPGPELPVDEEQPRQLLQNLRVKAVRVTPRTSDLFVTFEMGLELQTWSTNPHSRQWKFSDPTLTVVADSGVINSKALAARVTTEDTAAND